MKLPWFSLCWSPSEDMVHFWNQRSVTSSEQFDCPGVLCSEPRTMQLAQSQVEILMCGEVFNSRIRGVITQRRGKPIAVVGVALVHDVCSSAEKDPAVRSADMSDFFAKTNVMLIYRKSTFLTKAHRDLIDALFKVSEKNNAAEAKARHFPGIKTA